MITPHENKHAVISVYNPLHGVSIPIDHKLAPLLNLMWHLGIDTDQCCQEYCHDLDQDWAYISFPTTEGAGRFYTIAQRKYLLAATLSTDLQPGYQVWLKILFPTADIPYLIERFSAAILARSSTP